MVWTWSCRATWSGLGGTKRTARPERTWCLAEDPGGAGATRALADPGQGLVGPKLEPGSVGQISDRRDRSGGRSGPVVPGQHHRHAAAIPVQSIDLIEEGAGLTCAADRAVAIQIGGPDIDVQHPGVVGEGVDVEGLGADLGHEVVATEGDGRGHARSICNGCAEPLGALA
jgi:hypothetical protein